MKKIAIVLALFVLVGGASLFAQDRLTVDLSKLPATKNATAFTKNYDDFLIRFPAGLFPANTNWAGFDRIIVKAKYFNASGTEIRQADGKAMVVLIYDPAGDIRGPEMGPGPNTPLKQFNLGGGSSTIHTDRGTSVKLDKAPGAILFQNSDPGVAFIEVQEITFFKR